MQAREAVGDESEQGYAVVRLVSVNPSDCTTCVPVVASAGSSVHSSLCGSLHATASTCNALLQNTSSQCYFSVPARVPVYLHAPRYRSGVVFILINYGALSSFEMQDSQK